MHTNRNTTPPVEEEPTLIQRGLGWLIGRVVIVLLAIGAVLGALYLAALVPALAGPVLLVLVWAVSRWLKRTTLNPLQYAGDTGIALWLVQLPDRPYSNPVARVAYAVVRRPLLDVAVLIILAFAGIGIAEGQLVTGLNFGVGFAGIFAVISGRIAVAVLVRHHRRAKGTTG